MAKIKIFNNHKNIFLIPIILLVVLAMFIGISFAAFKAVKNFGNVATGYFPGNTYNLYYDDVNCSSSTIINGKEYGYNDYLCDLEEPVGYNFEGWYKGNTKITNNTIVLTNQDVTLTANFIPETYTLSFDGGNLLYNMPVNQALTTSGNMKYSVTDGVFEVTANRDDGWGNTDGRVYLENGKTYIFHTDTDGTWGGSNTDTVQAFLLYNGIVSNTNPEVQIYSMGSPNYEFNCVKSGVYWLRLDVNLNEATHHFWNISVKEKINSKTVSYNNTYGNLPTPTKGYYTFRNWYDGANLVQSSTIYTKTTDSELQAKYSYDYVCQYLDNTYSKDASDHTSVGTKYVCDLGDGVNRNFYILANDTDTGTVRMLMEHNITEGANQVTYSYTDAMAYFDEDNPGYLTAEAWIHAIDISLPDAYDIARAADNENWDGSAWYCFGSNVADLSVNPFCNNDHMGDYAWLYNYTAGCKTYNTTGYSCDAETSMANPAEAVSYWTGTIVANSSTYAHEVVRSARVSKQPLTTNHRAGVRPVVTIYTSSLYE